MKAIGLFGGTFNPIHSGHLVVAEEIRNKYNLDKVIFTPTFLPPHKEPSDLADAGHRLVMAHLATVSNPCFEVSDFEIGQGGKSYSITTVKHFLKLFSEGVQIYFIVGADILMDIPEWKNIEEMLKICKFIAVSRPGFDTEKIMNNHFLRLEGRSVPAALLENIYVEQGTYIDVSSTKIRQRVRDWKSIKYLVPETVEQYIHNHQLYL